MTFQKSIETCFEKYATFDGKASRSELWWFLLFEAIIAISLMFVLERDHKWGTGPFGILWYIGTMIPILSVQVRRLHDTNRSGWWLLLWFTTIGLPILIIFLVLPSRKELNNEESSQIEDANGLIE